MTARRLTERLRRLHGTCRAGATARRAQGTDAGMSLVEMVVTLGIMSLVFTMSAVTMDAFYGGEGNLQKSYSSFAEVLPASTTLQQFFRTLVEPAPTAANGVPMTAFLPTCAIGNTGAISFAGCTTSQLQGPFAATPNSATFATNLGNAAGPSLIQITTTANATGGLYTMVVNRSDPVANTCPGVGTLLSTTSTVCTWGTPRRVLVITDLVNGSAASTTPLLQYALSSNPNVYLTSTQLAAASGFGAGSCTTVAVCPITLVQTVTLNVVVKAGSGQPASYQTVVSALAPNYLKFVG